jgi:hypothetical protein
MASLPSRARKGQKAASGSEALVGKQTLSRTVRKSVGTSLLWMAIVPAEPSPLNVKLHIQVDELRP